MRLPSQAVERARLHPLVEAGVPQAPEALLVAGTHRPGCAVLTLEVGQQAVDHEVVAVDEGAHRAGLGAAGAPEDEEELGDVLGLLGGHLLLDEVLDLVGVQAVAAAERVPGMGLQALVEVGADLPEREQEAGPGRGAGGGVAGPVVGDGAHREARRATGLDRATDLLERIELDPAVDPVEGIGAGQGLALAAALDGEPVGIDRPGVDQVLAHGERALLG